MRFVCLGSLVLMVLTSFSVVAASSEVLPSAQGGAGITLTARDTLLTIETLRENFNAHDFRVSFFVVQDQQNPAAPLRLVPVFDGGREQTQLVSRQGADCVLADFRLQQVGTTVHLWRADRELGESDLDVQPIRIRHYILQHNTLQTPGRPEYYFDWADTVVSPQPACDVTDALTAVVDALGAGGG